MCLLQKKKKNQIFPGQEARLRFATQPSRRITGDNFALLSSPRCHQGRRLGSDEDVHATSQHRGKITPLHQVSVIGVFCLFFSLHSLCNFHLLLPWGGLPLDLPLTLPLFAECFCAVETNLFVTLLSAVQRSYGRPGDAAPGQDRGMEEDG